MQQITLRLKKCFENSLTVKVEHENEIMNFSSAPTLMAKTFVCTSQTTSRVCLLLIFIEKINKALLAEVRHHLTSYRGFSPYATFGTGKKSHQPKIALVSLQVAMCIATTQTIYQLEPDVPSVNLFLVLNRNHHFCLKKPESNKAT